MRSAHLWFALAVLPLTVAACGPSEPPTPLSRAEAYDAGLATLDGGDAAGAEAIFAGLVEGDPTDPVARAGLARALARQDRLAESILQDKLAYALDPRLAEVAYNVACSYARLGEQEEALRWLSRAWNGGIRDLNLIEQDPDLDALRQDHRFAFFLATGALSLAEREAVVQVSPAVAMPDQRVRIELTVVSLNRPLMAAPETLALRYQGDLSPGSLIPISRIERFHAGESGGREYFQRELDFEFVAAASMETMIGPFELTLDGRNLPVRPAWLSVREVLPDMFGGGRGDGAGGGTPDARSWFAPPSTLTDDSRGPFARWEEGPAITEDGGGTSSSPAARDLVVGIELLTDGIEVPAELALDLPAECDVWAHPRTTAFLRTRAEGASRVWFHRRLVGSAPPGQTVGGCPSPLPVRVTLGNETLFETELDW